MLVMLMVRAKSIPSIESRSSAASGDCKYRQLANAHHNSYWSSPSLTQPLPRRQIGAAWASTIRFGVVGDTLGVLWVSS